MKKIILSIFILVFSTISINAQNNTSKDNTIFTPKDSLMFDFSQSFSYQLRESRFELYPTQNIYNFLKLDTVTGGITIVQWGWNDNYRFEYELDSSTKLYEWEDEICGRFKLTPTVNMYIFLMIDQIGGRVWQVQWSAKKEENRIVLRIY